MTQDRWSSVDAYDAYVGRWSRRVAQEFVAWLDAGAGLHWLDVGCGTGALSAAVLDAAEPAALLGIDASPAYVDAARQRLGRDGVGFEVVDAAALAYRGSFDAAVSGLVVNFLPDPVGAVGAMRDAVVPRGVVGAYVWDYGGRMDFMRRFWDAAVSLDEAARVLDEGVRFPMCTADGVASLWEEAGLESVETIALDVPTVFAGFDDFWSPFLGGQGPAPSYLMSLPPARRDALRDAVRASLPVGEDGSISLIARAWAVRGRRPSAD